VLVKELLMSRSSSELVSALKELVHINEEMGVAPFTAFIRAFAQVVSATEEELELIGGVAELS
jgi:hypothetical protein